MTPPTSVTGSQHSRSPSVASPYPPPVVNSEGLNLSWLVPFLSQKKQLWEPPQGCPFPQDVPAVTPLSLDDAKTSRFGCSHTFGGEEANPTLQVHRHPWCVTTSSPPCARKLPREHPSHLRGGMQGWVLPQRSLTVRSRRRGAMLGAAEHEAGPADVAVLRLPWSAGGRSEGSREVEREMSRGEPRGRGKKGERKKRS